MHAAAAAVRMAQLTSPADRKKKKKKNRMRDNPINPPSRRRRRPPSRPALIELILTAADILCGWK